MIILLMGVSGAGKTTVGERLAARTTWVFVDGDDLHPLANIEKMSVGIPLNDEDRRPWLLAIRDVIDSNESAGTSAIIACSALKASYRQLLLEGTKDVRLVYLEGNPALIARRLRHRGGGHFFDTGLLSSQFAALEEPAGAVIVSVEKGLDDVVSTVVAALELESDSRSEEE